MSGYALPGYVPGIYNTASALPAAGTVTPFPTVAIAQDTGYLYVYNINSASWTLSLSGGVQTVALGGTGVSSVTTAPTATAFAGWDANSNLSANNFLVGQASTATAAGSTTLVVGSKQQQIFTGSTTQTVVLPVVSTLALGQSFEVINQSTGVVTVQSSGANTVLAMVAGSTATFTCILLTGTTAASWQVVGVAGQYTENNCPSGSAVTLSTATTTDVDSGGGTPVGIVLTAGVYDLQGVVQFIPSSATGFTRAQCWIGTATGNSSTGQDLTRNYAALTTASQSLGSTSIALPTPVYRISITSTTTYYMKAQATFTGGSMTADGNLCARRVY